MKRTIIIGSVVLLVIGLIIGIVIYLKKRVSANQATPNPGNSFAPGQNTPGGRIPVRDFPTRNELIAFAIKKQWGKNGDDARQIAATYDETKGTWTSGDWRYIITGNNPITARAFKGAGEKFDLSYSGQQTVYLS